MICNIIILQVSSKKLNLITAPFSCATRQALSIHTSGSVKQGGKDQCLLSVLTFQD